LRRFLCLIFTKEQNGFAALALTVQIYEPAANAFVLLMEN
jgi:hypothetical protein